MITIQPEQGGESENILRVDLSLPIAPSELRQLRDLLDDQGWSYEVDEIDVYLDRTGL